MNLTSLSKQLRYVASGLMMFMAFVSLHNAWRMGNGLPTPDLDYTTASVRMCIIGALVNASCSVWMVTGTTSWWLVVDRWLRRIVLVGGVFITARHVYAAIFEDYRVPRATSVSGAFLTGIAVAAIILAEINLWRSRNR